MTNRENIWDIDWAKETNSIMEAYNEYKKRQANEIIRT